MPGEITAVSRSSAIQDAGWLTRPRLIALFWLAAVIAVVVMARTGSVGWDSGGYWKTIQSVRQGSDPYAGVEVARQAFLQRFAATGTGAHPPFVYACSPYPPMTVPLLRFLAMFPGWVLGVLYVAAVATGALLQLWAGFQMADKDERRWLALMLPAMIFFPGLVTDDAVLSGNVAYLLYGLVLAAAVTGWKRGNWSWYYLAVLTASIFKAPLLSLLAFPVLMDRRQWFPTGIAASSGVLIFAAQSLLWPTMFREWLLNTQLMFDGGHDFGFGPAGMLGRALWSQGLAYSSATSILYVAFSVVLGILLLFLARRVREWNLPLESWAPVALVGTLLLNPRIMKYDLAAITIPMLLIGGRALRAALGRPSGETPGSNAGGSAQKSPERELIFAGAVCLLIPNAITVAGPTWVPVEFAVLLAVFALGVWSLDRFRIELQPEA